MNAKFAQIRKHVANNRTYYAFCAGSLATSAVVIWSRQGRTLLELPKVQEEMLKQGGHLVYKINGQDYALTNIDALNAYLS